MLDIVIVAAPVKAVPPVFNKVQVLPPPAGAAHFNPVGETELSATR